MKPCVNLRFEEHDALASLMKWNLVAARPSVNGQFRRMAGQVFAQFYQVHPLVGRPYLRDIVQTVNLGVKFIQLVHHP